MSDPQIPESNPNQKPFAAEPPPKISSNGGGKHSYHAHGPNPPETVNPDAATLREQWRFAVRQYSRWYSQAWGTAILAGVSFFALGWIIKVVGTMVFCWINLAKLVFRGAYVDNVDNTLI